ncbi:Sorting nexin-1 [Phytophthora ramorum]|uniref:PX domain-containing protein n=1 Tax=Phytophthora ramorum TaxID=164328 RepID=H3GCE5_PHYRM|nr:Sorting nexin-1 [Phytophthora ramorum]
MRRSNYTEQYFVKTMRGSRRELAIDSFSQTQASSSVWYYRVNVSVYEEVLVSTFIDEDSSDDEDNDDRSSGASQVVVEHYSILRRYSDFLQLYEHICAEVTGARTLPPFPGKELISPALKGMLRRESSSKTVLEDRSAKFEALLQWIESHPDARNCPAFVEFIGRPPQSHDGYVSLKEYTPSDWLSSLEQTAKGMESRRRRYSTGSSAGRPQFKRSSSEMTNSSSSFHRQHVESVREMSAMHGVTSASGSASELVVRYSM